MGLPPILDDPPGWWIPAESTRALYPTGATHSPITTALATRLRHIALHSNSLQDNVVMKIGDSITASNSYLHCFDGDVNNLAPSWEFNIDLGGRAALADVILHFRSARIGRTTPFGRESRAARVGAGAEFPLTGRTPPLEVELDATAAQFATVMYGTNDVGLGGSADIPLDFKLTPYARHLVQLIDWLLARGVVPVMSTIPPRNDAYEYLGIVETANAVVRAIAQGRQIPLIDYHREMLPLLELGLSSDGMHPSVKDYNSSCHFTPEGLSYGYNTRNLVTLQALDRLMKTVVDGVPRLDDDAPTLAGDGSRAAPFDVPSLPFSDLRDVQGLLANDFDDYGCTNARPGTGRDAAYRLTIDAPTTLRAVALDATPLPELDAGTAAPLDVDLHLLDASGTCVKSGDSVVVTRLMPGTYTFVVDQDATASLATRGEYILVVVPCDDDDRLCSDLAALP